MISCKGAHVLQDILLTGVWWDITYPWTYRHVEALTEERGMPVDHAIRQRWDMHYRPQLEEVCPSSANQPGVTSLRSATHQYLRHNAHAPCEPHHP